MTRVRLHVKDQATPASHARLLRADVKRQFEPRAVLVTAMWHPATPPITTSQFDYLRKVGLPWPSIRRVLIGATP